jgi:hypothetical protein
MPQGRVYEVDEVDREALQKSFEEEHQKFYLLLGFYITRWAHFDRAFFELCQLSLNADEEITASIFYRSPNLSDHIALAHRLLDIKLRKEKVLARKWAELKTRIDKGVAIRNYVAHQPVAQRAQKVYYPHENDKAGTKIKVEEAVLYIYNEFLKPKRSSIEYVGSDQLRAACDEAGVLLDEIRGFTDELRQRLSELRV